MKKTWTGWLGLALLATASVAWLSGCGGTATTPSKADKGKPAEHKDGDHKETGQKDGGHKEAGHAEAGHKEGGHKEGGHKEGGHDEKPLTEKDVKMPDSFKAGVTRLEELHKKIHHEIEEEGGLKHVHRIAEEMALVANGTKKLAAKDLPEDKQTEAGRLCNEVAGYYKPIDEVADAGKKAETEAIHKKMGTAIEKLKGLLK